MKSVRIAAAQTPEFPDDIEAALGFATRLSHEAAAAGVRLLCFPEGYLQGYFKDEMSARRVALNTDSSGFQVLLKRFPRSAPMIVMGFIEVSMGKLFNSALVIKDATAIGCYRKKHLLPSERIFTPGKDDAIFDVDGLKFGVNICYDTNFPECARRIADLGAQLIVCPANNMMRRDKAEFFKQLHNSGRGDRCRETGLWLISADVTGERDGRVSWGPTAVLDQAGAVVRQLPLEEPGLLIVDVPLRDDLISRHMQN